MDVQVQTVDPQDEAQFARWFAVFTAAEQHDRRDSGSFWQESELRGLALGDPSSERRHLLAVASGQDVGCARLDMPLADNLQLSRCLLSVLPQERRRGYGSALLAEGRATAAAAGRTTLVAGVIEPYDRGAARVAGVGFVRAHGFTLGSEDVRRDLALPPDEERLAAAEHAAAARAVGYGVRTWRHAVPAELLESRALLSEVLSEDAPSGEVDLEREIWDGERVRAFEAMAVRMGRRLWGAGAVGADGRLAAYSELTVSRGAPEQVWQWDTVVLPEHRGHGLGTLVKVANLRAVAADCPDARRVSTYNAESNVHMIRVNESLGFVPVERTSEWQRALP